jgi:hypothetical protein
MSSKENAKAHYDDIVELLDDYPRGIPSRKLDESVLSVQVRSGWETSAKDFTPSEYELLLTTGGPACRIIGQLNGGKPTSATLQIQDWGTPWTDYYDDIEDDVLLKFASQFYFGQ